MSPDDLYNRLVATWSMGSDAERLISDLVDPQREHALAIRKAAGHTRLKWATLCKVIGGHAFVRGEYHTELLRIWLCGHEGYWDEMTFHECAVCTGCLVEDLGCWIKNDTVPLPMVTIRNTGSAWAWCGSGISAHRVSCTRGHSVFQMLGALDAKRPSVWER